MFDIGFWEISLIGVIGLLVLGPERLPAVARVVGGYLRKARQTWAGVRSEISRELAAEDLKQAIKEPVEELRSALRESADDVDRVRRDAMEKVAPKDSPEVAAEESPVDAPAAPAPEDPDAAKKPDPD